MSKPLIIDVGANFGDFTIPAAKFNPTSQVLAIEPIPNALHKIEELVNENSLSNVIFLGQCVSQVAGKQNLYHYQQGDQGLTSLLPLKNKDVFTNEYWLSRDDVVGVSAKNLTVDCLPLEDMLAKISFSKIPFIKIDGQGKDLEILLSAGKFVETIEAGMLEVSATQETTLYEGEPTTYDALKTLHSLNFEVVAIKPNDPASNEFNIFFARKNLDWQEHLKLYGLNENPIVVGKNYWHVPSSSLEFQQNDKNEVSEFSDTCFPSEPNWFLTDDEKQQKVASNKPSDDRFAFYFDITDLINHARLMDNANGIQRVIFEFAKHISGMKETRFFYLNPFDQKSYYFTYHELNQQKDLSWSRNLWFNGIEDKGFSFFEDLLKKYLLRAQSFKAKIIRRLLPIIYLPVAKNMFVTVSKRYIKKRFVNSDFLGDVKRLEKMNKGDIVAIFGGIWNFQPQYEDFFREHKNNAFFVNYLHDVIPLVKENLVPSHLNTIFKDYLPYMLRNSHLIVTSAANNITDLHTVANKYHPDLEVPKAIPVGLFYGFNETNQGEAKHVDLRPEIRGVFEQTFVLCAGTIEPRKNHLGLLQAWQKFVASDEYNGEILAIAGGWGHEVENIKKALFYTGHFGGTVIIIERPSDIELAQLYKRCKFTIYASHYEGWGLPISESMYFGKPVIHFNNSCLTEVSAGAAYVVNDCQGLERAIKDLFANDEIYKHYCDRINSIKEGFPTWSDISERILRGIYASIQ